MQNSNMGEKNRVTDRENDLSFLRNSHRCRFCDHKLSKYQFANLWYANFIKMANINAINNNNTFIS